jgi:hypothetical protein
MKVKFCPGCKEERPIETFCFKNKSKGTLQPYCDNCRKPRAQISYMKSQKKNVERAVKNGKIRREIFVEFKKMLECYFCLEKEYFCFDFHHLDPLQKEFEISLKIARFSYKKVFEEIKKCICVCANCHRKIHAYGMEVVSKIYQKPVPNIGFLDTKIEEFKQKHKF